MRQSHKEADVSSLVRWRKRTMVALGMAHAFIDAIANAGADAVKFQTHIAAAERPQESHGV